MMKNKVCPKCNNKNILIIKDVWHSTGGGNISQSRHFFTENSCAKVTYYICTNCGYVEEYLDKEELYKLMKK